MHIVLTPERIEGEQAGSLVTREYRFGFMHIFMAIQSSTRGLSFRHLTVLSVSVLLLASATVGGASYLLAARINEWVGVADGKNVPSRPRVSVADRRLAAHRRSVEAAIRHRVHELEASISAQRQTLIDTRVDADSQLDELGRQIGILQAQLTRLNALGERLTSMSGLDGGEFDFDERPSLGGPVSGSLIEESGTPELFAVLDDLTRSTETSYRQLAVLDSLILQRGVAQAQYPQGWPTDGGWISSNYGHRRDPFTGRRTFHHGVDIANQPHTPIRAVASGVVARVSTDAGYGAMVEVNHGNGFGTRYAHAASVNVGPGERVQRGQVIATVGSSGRSTGPHLHFEVVHGSSPVDPHHFLHTAR